MLSYLSNTFVGVFIAYAGFFAFALARLVSAYLGFVVFSVGYAIYMYATYVACAFAYTAWCYGTLLIHGLWELTIASKCTVRVVRPGKLCLGWLKEPSGSLVN
jgi:hypothetical protein